MTPKPLAVIDIESTGPEPQEDSIFSFGCVTIYPDGKVTKIGFLMKPWKPIPPDVEELTGTTNEMLVGKPEFKVFARDILEHVDGPIIAGFNSSRFDTAIIWEELNRCGIKWDVSKLEQVDVFKLYQKFHPRNLTACVREYCGRDHEGAHGALPDAEATYECLVSMQLRHDEISTLDLPELAEFSTRDDRDGFKKLDLYGIIMENKEGIPVYGTKRNKGMPIASDTSYGEWMMSKDFSAQTKMVLGKILENIYKDRRKTEGDMF